MTEEWKEIEGFSNYSVSNQGKIKNIRTGKILKPCINSWGYSTVNLYRDKKSFSKKLHRLVLSSFKEKPKNKNMCNHVDGNKQNNSISNLEWCNHRENMEHAKKLGLYKNNGQHRKKLTSMDIKRIKKLIENGVKVVKIAQHFKVSTGYLYEIYRGEKRENE